MEWGMREKAISSWAGYQVIEPQHCLVIGYGLNEKGAVTSVKQLLPTEAISKVSYEFRAISLKHSQVLV